MERPRPQDYWLGNVYAQGRYDEDIRKYIDHLESLLNEERIVGILQGHEVACSEGNWVTLAVTRESYEDVAKEITKGGKE